jgi:hypothetical protein
MMQDGAAAGGTPYELEAASAGELQVVAPARGLIAPERHGGPRPGVDATEGFSGPAGAEKQRLIDRHVRGAVGGSRHEHPLGLRR